jgi:hypothetical protein
MPATPVVHVAVAMRVIVDGKDEVHFSRVCQNFRGLSLDWDNSIDGLVFRAGDAQH